MKQYDANTVEKYLRNEMTEIERIVFEQEAKNSTIIQREIRLQKTELFVMDALGDDLILSQMAKWEQEKKTNSRWVVAGAGLLFLLVCACAYYLSGRSNAAQEDKVPAKRIEKDTVSPIAEEQTLPFNTNKRRKTSSQQLLSLVEVPNLSTLSKRNITQNEVDPFASIKKDMESGHFLRAIQSTKKLMRVDSLHNGSNIELLGTLYLKNGDFISAITTYQSIEANFREEVEWNLLIAYQMAGKDFLKEKQQLINAIATDTGHPAYLLYQKNQHLFQLK
jgi:cytochrome c-type biogenesis protein CcmH/NrfG